MALDAVISIIHQLLTHQPETPVQTKQGVRGAQELVWVLWKREKSLAPAMFKPKHLICASHYTK
jgi:hypothetical protein